MLNRLRRRDRLSSSTTSSLMSVESWRAPPTPPAPQSVSFTGVNMSSPPPAVYGATPAPYDPVYPFPLGPDVPADPSNQPSGHVSKRRQNDNCYYCHQPGHFKAACPQRQRRAQGASAPKSGTRTYLRISVGGHQGACLLDTGCDHSMLPRRLVRNTPLQPINIRIFAANGTPIPVMGTVTLGFQVD